MSKDKVRLDVLLVERGLAETREKARRLTLAGHVEVDGRIADKPGMAVPRDADVRVREGLPFVSRGGLKLAAALDAFGIAVDGLVAADFGASTGGFTDCLLQRGARRVYALDVGYGQLAWPLRDDPRVVVMDRVNVRYLEGLPEAVDLVTIDVSFISLGLVLPAALRVLKPESGQVVALVKPQFEAGRDKVGKGGVVKDPAVHREVLEKVRDAARGLGFRVRGLIRSPITGPAGNAEFLLYLALAGCEADWEAALGRALQETQPVS
ncbi:MAG: TlyA family RNA methyltransferase [Anaerolineae bacterium]|nr:TlyA family RNA methyltransferase [Anaerolineae bacterium]